MGVSVDRSLGKLTHNKYTAFRIFSKIVSENGRIRRRKDYSHTAGRRRRRNGKVSIYFVIQKEHLKIKKDNLKRTKTISKVEKRESEDKTFGKNPENYA